MKIVFFEADQKTGRETVSFLQQQRMNGNLVFVCSGKPYYQTYYRYFRYANGFVCNDYGYVQMGCCEVMRDDRYSYEKTEDLYEKVKMYGTLILHGSRDSYAYKDTLTLKEYRIIPYANQPVYSFSVYLKDCKYLDAVNHILESEYEIKQEGEFLVDLHRRSASLKEACNDVCSYFHIPVENVEIR